jgi:putative transposase
MPRLGRVVLPNDPHHVVQRGHNKQLVFAEDADDRYDLDTLATFKGLLDIKVYAFCLMSNNIHLIVQPGEAIAELGRLMKHLAGRQTRFVNRQAARSGTLWEGRYKSSPIETDADLLSPAAAMSSSTRRVRG